MMAQTLMFFTLKDIAKLNTYCEATPYSHMWHMNVLTRRHVCVLGYIIIMCVGLAADVQTRRWGDHQNYIILQLFYVRIHDESSKEVFNMRLQYESSVGA